MVLEGSVCVRVAVISNSICEQGSVELNNFSMFACVPLYQHPLYFNAKKGNKVVISLQWSRGSLVQSV